MYPRNASVSFMVKKSDLSIIFLFSHKQVSAEPTAFFFLSEFSNISLLKRNDFVWCDAFMTFCDTSICYTKGRHCYSKALQQETEVVL